MKIFFYKVSFLLFLIVVTCIIIEIMIRLIPNEYRYKKEYLDNESNNIEVLFLGSSDANAGFNPTYTRKRSFNAAHPSLSYDYIFEILKKYEYKWSKLEYIVLTVSYPSLFYKMGQSKTDGWRVKNYTIYYRIKISKLLRSHAEILNGRLFDHMFRLFKYYLQNIDEIGCSDKGWFVSSTSMSTDSLLIDGKIAAERHESMRNKQYFGEMKSEFDSIIDFSKRNNCKIILCTPPGCKSYRENLNKYQLDSTINLISKIAKENNCTYINLLDDPRFKERDFLNGDHLNGNGARKLTLIIDSIINTGKMGNE